jgi:hypothetical protein
LASRQLTGIGPTPPRRCHDRSRDPARLLARDITDDAMHAIADHPVDADTFRGCTRLDPITAHEFGTVDRNKQSISPSRHHGQILGLGMRHLTANANRRA